MARNMFAEATTEAQLGDLFDEMVSPENISHDGERSRASINAAYRRIDSHYLTRLRQLRKASAK